MDGTFFYKSSSLKSPSGVANDFLIICDIENSCYFSKKKNYSWDDGCNCSVSV